jgi:hypothetical protein
VPSVLFRETQRTCLFVAMFLAMVLMVVDLLWWSPGEGFAGVGGQPAFLALCVLGFLLLASMVDRHLRTFGPPAATVRPRVAIARFLLAGVPLAGLLTIPAWRWLGDHPRSRIARACSIHGEADSPADSRAAGGEWLLRRTGGSYWLHRLGVGALGLQATWPRGTSFGMVFVLFGSLGLCAAWVPLCRPEWAPGGPWIGWGIAIGLTALFHLAGAAAAFAVLASEARHLGLDGRRAWMLEAPAVLWLVPIPFAALLGVAWLFTVDMLPAIRGREKALVNRAFDRSGSLLLRAPWRGLHEELGRRSRHVPWFQLLGFQLGEIERPREVSRAVRRRNRLRRLLLALWCCGLAQATVVWLAVAGSPSVDFAKLLADSALSFGSGALAGVMIVQVFRRRKRLPEPRWASVGGALGVAAWVGLLGALGMEVGLAIAVESAERLGWALAVGGGVGLALTMFRVQLRAVFSPLPGSSQQDDRFALLLAGVFLAIAVLGLVLMNETQMMSDRP